MTHVRHTFLLTLILAMGEEAWHILQTDGVWQWALRMAIEIRQQMGKGRVEREAV